MRIRLKGIRKSFGSHDVLKGLDLYVPSGATAVIIGPSGAGKSLILKQIIGLLKPDGGSVEVAGARVDELEGEALEQLRRKMGYVFQFGALFDSMTVRENVEMGLGRDEDRSSASARSRVHECLASVYMEEFAERYPAELSGGQRKRASMARALAGRPGLLLYDEPTTGLDPVSTAVIDHLIETLKRERGVTGVAVTHDMRSARRIGDSITLLYGGRARFCGSPAELDASTDPVLRGFVDGDPGKLRPRRD